MLFISWNINGIARRFDEVKRLAADYSPDFLCLQKVRSHEDSDSLAVDGYRLLLAPLDRGDWSGVAVYVSQDSGITSRRIETPELSQEGHLQVFDCGSFALLNTYVPFANQKLDGAVEFRRRWDDAYRSFVRGLSRKLPLIICGDMNVVHTEYDTCERRLESTRPNFTRWERDNFNSLISGCDLADPYRIMHPTEKKPTYYGAWRHLRTGNRIDYFLISRSLLPRVIAAEILTDFGSGQSVPITFEIDL